MTHDSVTRRSVLKATGAAAGATVVGAAPAAASWYPGQCVVLASHVDDGFDEACPARNRTPAPPKGTEGEIVATCTGDAGTWAEVDWPSYPTAWFDTADLDYC